MADAITSRRPLPSRRMVRSMPAVQLAGLVIVTVVSVFGGIDAYRMNLPAQATAANLDDNLGRAVRVDCSAPLDDPDMRIADDEGSDSDSVVHVLLCKLGARSLVVLADSATEPQELVGTLRPITADDIWAKPIRDHGEDLGPTYDALFLDLTSRMVDRVLLGLVCALALGGLVGWGLFVRRWRRRRIA
jgi:hypothetical protein